MNCCTNPRRQVAVATDFFSTPAPNVFWVLGMEFSSFRRTDIHNFKVAPTYFWIFVNSWSYVETLPGLPNSYVPEVHSQVEFCTNRNCVCTLRAALFWNSLRNNPEERSSHLLCCGRLQSRGVCMLCALKVYTQGSRSKSKFPTQWKLNVRSVTAQPPVLSPSSILPWPSCCGVFSPLRKSSPRFETFDTFQFFTVLKIS